MPYVSDSDDLHDVDAACPNSKEIWKCVSVDALVRRSWCNHSEHAECREVEGEGEGEGGGADRTGSTVNYHWALSELLSRVHVRGGGGSLWFIKS